MSDEPLFNTTEQNNKNYLFFPVFEFPVKFEDRYKRMHDINTHKCLVRPWDNNGSIEPKQLAIVGKTYKVIQNKELFAKIDREMVDTLPNEIQEGMYTVDSTAGYGATCYREYICPSYRIPQTDEDIRFRLIVRNGFGGTSLQVIGGAIDFFCTNGLITGTYDRAYYRHTKGLVVSKIGDAVNQCVKDYLKLGDDITYMQSRKPKPIDEVKEWLKEHGISERASNKITERLLQEKRDRGNNLWAIYSALTNWATHEAVRSTGNDHERNTIHNRQVKVSNLGQMIHELEE